MLEVLAPRNAAEGLFGKLRLTFRIRNGQTSLAEQYDQAPLKVVRPFDAGDGRVLVQIANTTAGILAGDRCRIAVRVEAGAKVILVSQSATKVHSMPADASASEHISARVEAGGELELYPGLVIPFPQADFSQVIDVSLAAGAKFGFLESWAMGRVERGEHLAFRRMSSRVRVTLDGSPCYRDALDLAPGARPVSWGVLEGHRYSASGYWLWDAPLPLEPCVGADPLLATVRPAKGSLFLRALGHDGHAFRQAIGSMLAHQRRAWGLAEGGLWRYLGLTPP